MTMSCSHDTEKLHKIVKPKQNKKIRSLEFTDGAVTAHSSILNKVFSLLSATSREPEQDLAHSHNTVREKSLFNQATKTVQNSTDLRKDTTFVFK